jgi:hypothetical protein
MTEVDIPLPSDAKSAAIVKAVEFAAKEAGLTLALKGTLATYPGCIHWHCKNGKDRGTLEITWWPQKKRLWFKVAANRRGDWVPGAVSRLKQSIAAKL